MKKNWRAERLAKRALEEQEARRHLAGNDDDDDGDSGADDAPVKMSAAKRIKLERERLLRTAGREEKEQAEVENNGGDDAAAADGGGNASELTAQEKAEAATLLDTAVNLQDKIAAMSSEEALRYEQTANEARLLKEANTVSSNALTNAKDEAVGLKYTESMKTR